MPIFTWPFLETCSCSVADPDPESGAIVTPGSGIRYGKKIRIRDPDPGSGSGMNNPDHISDFFGLGIFCCLGIFGLKYLNSFMRIWDPRREKYGSGINIQDPQHCVFV